MVEDIEAVLLLFVIREGVLAIAVGVVAATIFKAITRRAVGQCSESRGWGRVYVLVDGTG